MERTKSYTPLPPSSGKYQCQRTEGYRRSSSFTHSHASPRAPCPWGQIHNPHHILLLLLLQHSPLEAIIAILGNKDKAECLADTKMRWLLLDPGRKGALWSYHNELRLPRTVRTHSPSTLRPLQLNTQDLPRKPHLSLTPPPPTAHHSLHCGLLGPLWSLLFASRLPRAACYFLLDNLHCF